MKALPRIIGILILLQVLARGGCCGEQEQLLAQHLVAKGGISRGLCANPRCGTGKLAVALARASNLLVHAQDPLPDNVAFAQRLADAEGLLGKRVVVEKGGTAILPYADNTVDLVVLTDMVPSQSARAISAAEVLRVLSPNGKAILGCAHATGPPEAAGRDAPGSTEADLRKWVAEQGLNNAVVTRDAHGVWVEFSKALPQGADTWSHWMHGPDNNPVSTDTAITAPYLTQWLGRPYYTAMPVVTTAAGGRIFVAMGHIAQHDREIATLNTLYARNGYNGTVLWKRRLPEGYLVHRSAFIATEDTFYLADKNGALMFDPLTGREKGRIAMPEAQGDWKWIALSGGTLFVLAGESDPVEPTTIVSSQRDHWSWGQLSRGYYQRPRIPWGFATTLAAYDLERKKALWVRQEPKAVDSRAVGLSEQRLFFYSPDSRIGCIDARSGRIVWTNSDAELLRLIEEPGKNLTSTPGFRTCCTLLCTPDVLFFEAQTQMNVVAVSARSGQLLWTKAKSRNNPNLLFVEGRVVIAGIGAAGSTLMLDATTGEVVKDLNFQKGNCTRMTASPDSFFCRGEGLGRHDRLAGKYAVDGSARPGCMDGAIPANGLLYLGPWLCDCNLSLMGTIALCSAKDFQFDQAGKEEERLEFAGAADSARGLTVTDLDWPTYRGNNSRSGGSKALLAANPQMLWQYKASGPVEPTAAVSAGGSVFFCGSDGKVVCLEAGTGKPRWNFPTGGPVRWPPTIHDGMAYVGSGDGFVYALEAATGKLLWRFRAAPIHRRIMVYDSLCSTWPVNSGVLVEGGVAYAAAGIIDRDGTYVYALDAKTGQIKWQNSESGHLNSEIRKGVSVQGYLTVAKGHLWLAGGNQVSPAAYSLETGRYASGQVPMGRPSALRGCDVGVFRGRYLLHGGALLYADDGNAGGGRVVSPAQHSFAELSDDGARGATVIPFARSSIPPAWDDQAMVFPTERYTNLMCWDAGQFDSALKSAREHLAQTRPRDFRLRQVAEQAIAQRMRSAARWGPVSAEVLALAVAGNGVVLACEAPGATAQTQSWEVRVLDRQDGRVTWRGPIPAQPLLNGLHIDRRGWIIVVMKDGSIACLGEKG